MTLSVLSTFATVPTDFHMHQCVVAAFALAWEGAVGQPPDARLIAAERGWSQRQQRRCRFKPMAGRPIDLRGT
jgi:hypothetical protein